MTKDWYKRLLLDPDVVPFERCTQARNSAVNLSRSSTIEFPRCYNIQIKTIQFDGELCYRCFSHQRLVERTKKIKDVQAAIELLEKKRQKLEAERKTFKIRSEMFGNTESKDVEFTREMRQTIKESPRFSEKTERLRSHIIKSGFLPQSCESVRWKVVDWEERLHAQLACSGLKKRKSAEKRAEGGSGEQQGQEEKKQAKRSSLQKRLAEANRRVDSPVLEGNEEAAPLITHPSAGPSAEEPVVRYHTIATGIVANAIAQIEETPFQGARPSVVKSASLRGLNASVIEKAEFKPFQRPPPTGPWMMRAPTAPRAMREGSLKGATWQPHQHFSTAHGYPTYHGW